MTDTDLNGWKPVSTAPHGKYVLVLRDSGMMGIEYECLTARYSTDKERWNCVQNDALSDSGCQPTHWRPLPSPPANWSRP